MFPMAEFKRDCRIALSPWIARLLRTVFCLGVTGWEAFVQLLSGDLVGMLSLDWLLIVTFSLHITLNPAGLRAKPTGLVE